MSLAAKKTNPPTSGKENKEEVLDVSSMIKNLEEKPIKP